MRRARRWLGFGGRAGELWRTDGAILYGLTRPAALRARAPSQVSKVTCQGCYPANSLHSHHILALGGQLGIHPWKRLDLVLRSAQSAGLLSSVNRASSLLERGSVGVLLPTGGVRTLFRSPKTITLALRCPLSARRRQFIAWKWVNVDEIAGYDSTTARTNYGNHGLSKADILVWRRDCRGPDHNFIIVASIYALTTLRFARVPGLRRASQG